MKISEKHLRSLIRNMYLNESTVYSAVDSGPSKITSTGVGGSIGSFEGVEFESVPSSSSAKIAMGELSFWKDGKRKESQNDEETNDKLKKYWQDANYAFSGNPWSAPWSAAFISHVMKKAGEASSFSSAAHTTWATRALKNRNKILANPEEFIGKTLYVLFMKDEVKPEVGDIPFKLRGGGDINAWIAKGGGSTKSHSDIYVGGDKVIGGNLSDSVKKSNYDHPTIIKKIKITGVSEKEDQSKA